MCVGLCMLCRTSNTHPTVPFLYVQENERVSVLAGQHRHFSENIVKRIYKATLFLYSKVHGHF